MIDFVVGSDIQKNYLEGEESRLLDLLEQGGEGGDDGEDMGDFDEIQTQLDTVYQRLDAIGARNAEARARAILTGLQFTRAMQDGPIARLSGGWRMRVRLACALFVTPDILLLDEPTNHLDFPAVEWLAGFLKLYEPTLLVVSHDRGFLDQVMTDCIDFRDKTLMYYRGDYSNYLKVRKEHIAQHNRLWEKTEKKRAALTKFILEARAKAHDDPNLAELAKTRQRLLDQLPVMEEIKEDRAISFTFPEPGKLDHSIMSCKNMSFHYDKTADGVNKPYMLNNINAVIDMDSRIGILGANGAGKTTLINVMLGKYEPLAGECKLNDQARVKIFTQHHLDQLDPAKTPLEFMTEKFPQKREGEMRGFLGRFGLDRKLAEQKIELLSGGQKSRVAFAVLTCSNPHLIIMDEPTNHLDIETIESLIHALNSFAGGVIVISHDRYFLTQTAQEYWAVSAEGTMKIFYDLDEAKDYSYKPIEYIVEGAKRRAESKKADVIVNADEEKLKRLQADLAAVLAAAGGDDDDDDEDALQAAAVVAAATEAAFGAPAPKTGKAAKAAEPEAEAEAEDDDEAAMLAMMAGLADEEEAEEEEKPKAKKDKKKGKKAAAEAEAEAEDDEAAMLAMMAGLADDDDAAAAEEAAPAKKDKKAKKGKKAAAADEDADADAEAEMLAMMAGLAGDDDEEAAEEKPKAKKDKKKGKKAAEVAAEDDEDDMLAMMAGLAGDGDDDEALEEEEEEDFAAAAKNKKDKKKSASAVAMAALLAKQQAEAAAAKAGGKKKKGKRDDFDDDLGEIPTTSAEAAAAAAPVLDVKALKKLEKKNKGKKDNDEEEDDA